MPYKATNISMLIAAPCQHGQFKTLRADYAFMTMLHYFSMGAFIFDISLLMRLRLLASLKAYFHRARFFLHSGFTIVKEYGQ